VEAKTTPARIVDWCMDVWWMRPRRVPVPGQQEFLVLGPIDSVVVREDDRPHLSGTAGTQLDHLAQMEGYRPMTGAEQDGRPVRSERQGSLAAQGRCREDDCSAAQTVDCLLKRMAI
jgi:hypothetical protein